MQETLHGFPGDISANYVFGPTAVFFLGMSIGQPWAVEWGWATGRRIAVVWSLMFFLVGGVGCAEASHPLVLLVSRAIQGLGAGGAESSMVLIMFDLWDNERRWKWTTLINTVWALGIAVGPILGGISVRATGLPMVGTTFFPVPWTRN